MNIRVAMATRISIMTTLNIDTSTRGAYWAAQNDNAFKKISIMPYVTTSYPYVNSW